MWIIAYRSSKFVSCFCRRHLNVVLSTSSNLWLVLNYGYHMTRPYSYEHENYYDSLFIISVVFQKSFKKKFPHFPVKILRKIYASIILKIYSRFWYLLERLRLYFMDIVAIITYNSRHARFSNFIQLFCELIKWKKKNYSRCIDDTRVLSCFYSSRF